MGIETIDQTASEVRLHRVLWLIKLLRATVLHLLLGLVAVLLYFLAGIDGVYALATDMIHAMRAEAIQNQLEGAMFGPSSYAAMASLVFVALLGLLIWIYRSITNVRRRALQVQAILILVIALLSAPSKWQEVRFAFENLDLLFAVLAAFGVALNFLVVPLSVVFALWVVARSSEQSSFMATLDPRLAPGFLDVFEQAPRPPAYAVAKPVHRGGVCARARRRASLHRVDNVFAHWREYLQQGCDAGNRVQAQ